jgi:hypothetical protein
MASGLWDDWESSDKLPLGEFVRLVAEEYVSGAEAFEAKHPGNVIGNGTVMARAVTKPMTNKKTGETRVFYDNDESGRIDRTDIPIPIIRKPGA